MIKKIRKYLEKEKISTLIDILRIKGTFENDYDGIPRRDEERAMLNGLNVFYHQGHKTEEELFEVISIANDLAYHPLNPRPAPDAIKRASTWFLHSQGFRERMLNFYFNHLLPFSNSHSYWEILRLHGKYSYKAKNRS